MEYKKKYKEAQKWIESIYPELNHEQQMEAEAFFPELKESEDEKIRKELLSFCQNRADNYPNDPKYANIGNWIAWLEKQKELELSEDLGEYIVELSKQFPEVSFAKLSRIAVRVKNWFEKQEENKSTTIDIDKMVSKYANTREDCTHGLPVNCQIRAYRQGINDALKSALNLEKQGEPIDINPSEFDLRLNKLLKQFETLPKEELANSLSFYLNVVQNDGTYKPDEKQGGQKPVDKVESFDEFEGLTDFERTLADICIGWIGEELGWKQYIKDNADVLLKIAIEKFNSVQDASFEQKPAWSEEDEVKINRIVACLENLNVADNDILLKDVDWLKSLRPQPKQEWSEEDKDMVRYIGNALTCNESAKYLEEKGIDMIKAHCWLEFFKPQKQWKPSDEQMVALSEASGIVGMYSLRGMNLQSLYNDLKKL